MIRLALRVSAEHADIVLAELLELVPAGVEEVHLTPEGDPLEGAGSGDVVGGLIEYAVYGAPGELPRLPDLRAAVGGAPIEVRTSELADDWGERWKQYHRPVLIEGRRRALHVRAPWMPAFSRGGIDEVGGVDEIEGVDDVEGVDQIGRVDEIVIDPGQAFGTGAHPTTRLCLELLLTLAGGGRDRGSAIDVGAGSGVLAIAAARLGYRPVLALDNEPESVSAIVHNAAVNCVAVEARRFDLRREQLPAPGERPYVVLANLLRGLLLELSESIAPMFAPTHLIASGLLCEEADEVARAFAERLSLREQARRECGEWAALWLSRE